MFANKAKFQILGIAIANFRKFFKTKCVDIKKNVNKHWEPK